MVGKYLLKNKLIFWLLTLSLMEMLRFYISTVVSVAFGNLRGPTENEKHGAQSHAQNGVRRMKWWPGCKKHECGVVWGYSHWALRHFTTATILMLSLCEHILLFYHVWICSISLMPWYKWMLGILSRLFVRILKESPLNHFGYVFMFCFPVGQLLYSSGPHLWCT